MDCERITRITETFTKMKGKFIQHQFMETTSIVHLDK